jgi:hypothetical protein
MMAIGFDEFLIVSFGILLFYIVPLLICYRIVVNDSLPKWRWLILTAIFGWPIVIALLVMRFSSTNKD